MDEAISAAVPRFNVDLFGLFAALAVLLSAVGVYGVTWYAVSQRTQEIGVRMALGAGTGDVLFMVIREALALGLVAVGVGLVGAVGFTRTMASMLSGVAPTDTSALAAAPAILLAVTLVAAYVPARRAAMVDPMVALRTE